MKLYKTEAIILRAINIREADLLIILFSREYGKMRVMAHGACKPTSRKRGFVQPFCYSRFLLHKGREIDSISQGEGLELFPDLPKNLRTLSCASYLAELVENLTAEGEANEDVFLLLLQAFRLITRGDEEVITRAFEARLVSFLGYRPALQRCVNCRQALTRGQVAFSVAAGGVLCPSCARQEGRIFWCQRGTIETLKIFLRWELARLQNLKINARARKELSVILKSYMEYHLGYQSKATEFLQGPTVVSHTDA